MLESKIALPPERPGVRIGSRSLIANTLIFAASAGLAVWSFHLLRDKLTTVVSRDAVINGTLIDLNAPIDGTVTRLAASTGTPLKPNQSVLTLTNARVLDQTSQLPVQEIKTRINDLQVQIARAQGELNRTLGMQQVWTTEQATQQKLETIDAAEAVRQAEAELQAARSRYRLAELSYQRQAALYREGATPEATLDVATLERDELAHTVQSLEARLDAMQNQQKASQVGVSLVRERGNYSPRFRLQDLELDAAKQRQEITNLQQNLADAKAELAQAIADVQRQETELKLNQQTEVMAPASGVIWELSAKQGQFVEKGATLGRLLDCSRRWVDVFVDEQAVRSIQPGTPATIELYGSGSQTLKGKVSLIRSGLGRLQPGQEVAVPITPNLPRTTQVRVALDPSTATGSPDVMCYVGYTGRVSFQL
jgi:multidrug resistance efflux pump